MNLRQLASSGPQFFSQEDADRHAEDHAAAGQNTKCTWNGSYFLNRNEIYCETRLDAEKKDVAEFDLFKAPLVEHEYRNFHSDMHTIKVVAPEGTVMADPETWPGDKDSRSEIHLLPGLSATRQPARFSVFYNDDDGKPWWLGSVELNKGLWESWAGQSKAEQWAKAEASLNVEIEETRLFPELDLLALL